MPCHHGEDGHWPQGEDISAESARRTCRREDGHWPQDDAIGAAPSLTPPKTESDSSGMASTLISLFGGMVAGTVVGFAVFIIVYRNRRDSAIPNSTQDDSGGDYHFPVKILDETSHKDDTFELPVEMMDKESPMEMMDKESPMEMMNNNAFEQDKYSAVLMVTFDEESQPKPSWDMLPTSAFKNDVDDSERDTIEVLACQDLS